VAQCLPCPIHGLAILPHYWSSMQPRLADTAYPDKSPIAGTEARRALSARETEEKCECSAHPNVFTPLPSPVTHRQQQSGDQVEEELQESTMAGKWVGGREAWGWAGFCSRGRERAERFCRGRIDACVVEPWSDNCRRPICIGQGHWHGALRVPKAVWRVVQGLRGVFESGEGGAAERTRPGCSFASSFLLTCVLGCSVPWVYTAWSPPSSAAAH